MQILRPGLGPRAAAEGPVALLLECHGRIRRFAGIAVRLATIEAPGAELAEAAAAVARYFGVALPLHVLDEERSLRPRLEAAAGAALRDALAAMSAEHRVAEERLARLLPAWRAVAADPARRAAHGGLLGEESTLLSAELEAHLAAEETIVFPAIGRLLAPAALAEVSAEMRARRG